MDKQVAHAEHISLQKKIFVCREQSKNVEDQREEEGPNETWRWVCLCGAVKKTEEKGGYEGNKKTLKTKHSRAKDKGRDGKKK